MGSENAQKNLSLYIIKDCAMPMMNVDKKCVTWSISLVNRLLCYWRKVFVTPLHHIVTRKLQDKSMTEHT